MRVCSVDGCTTAANARGLCKTHYTRWRRHGDPNGRDPAAVCAVCRHPQRELIESLVLAGEMYRHVKDRYGVNPKHHAREHMQVRRPGHPCLVCEHDEADAVDELLALRHELLPDGNMRRLRFDDPRRRLAYSAIAASFDGLTKSSVRVHDQPRHQAHRAVAQVSRLKALRKQQTLRPVDMPPVNW